MKKTNLISLFGTLFILFLLIGCSPENTNDEQQINHADLTNVDDFSNDIPSENNQRGGGDVVDVRIEYYPWVLEQRKQEIRDKFRSLGILVSYTLCTNDPNTDIWIIYCDDCDKDSDVPIKTDDCEDEEETCDVAKVSIFEPCKRKS